MNRWRNRLAWRLCNWLLNHVATVEYRTGIKHIVRLGMSAHVREWDDA